MSATVLQVSLYLERIDHMIGISFFIARMTNLSNGVKRVLVITGINLHRSLKSYNVKAYARRNIFTHG
jgi:hypothetical protein